MCSQTDRWPPDPINRQSEVMFGLRMTLIFTGTRSVALGAGATVRGILLAARGCNIARGPVDAAVCLLTSATEHGQGRAQAAAIRAASETEAKVLLRALMPGRAGEALSDAQVGAVPGWVRDTPQEPDVELDPQRQDFIAAGQVFLPVTGALPFPRSCRFLSLNRCRWRCVCQMRSRLQCSLSLAGGWINRCRAGGV